MLGHRQELHVREARREDVLGEFMGQLPVVQPFSPRAEVNLVDRQGALVLVHAGTLLEPLLVRPLVPRGVHDGARRWWHLGGEGQGIGFVLPDAVPAQNRELVDGAVAKPGHEQLPDPG